MHHVVFDIETQNSFQDIGGSTDYRKLKVSVVGVYSSADDSYRTYRESDLSRLWPVLERADLLIGYNVKGFDIPVLHGYYRGNLEAVPTLDIMEDITKVLGFRVKLDSVAQGTLGAGKSGSGLQAIQFFRDRQWEKLEAYCLDDVRLTKELYEYGREQGKLLVRDRSGENLTVPVDFKRFSSVTRPGINLTIPL